MKNLDPVGHSTLETMSFAKWYNEKIFSLIAPYIGESTLEIGAGIGNFTGLLQKTSKVTATDINQEYIRKLKRTLGNGSRAGYGDIEANKFFFSKRSFDTVVGLNVLEHIKDDRAALKNINKLLIRGGTLILLVPAHEGLYSKFDKRLGHFRRYTLESIGQKLVENGFKIEKISYINWWGAVGWLVFMKFFKRDYIPKLSVVIFDHFGKVFLIPEKVISIPFGLSVIVIARKI